jgi:lipopolysaccharide/colanic/teichoic acid biosynthesis glycosyltransferase
MFIIGLIIKIDSKGPIFFIQQRMGKNQKLFNLVKFRTMTNKPRKPNGEVFLNNPEITQVGRILRRTKLDEIPQFINVLIGDMYEVGPRPCLKSTYEKFKNEDTDFRFLVKPGVTSNAGVSGSIYLSWKEKWSLDRSYAENKTFILDIKIILKTILVVILGEGRFKK